MTANSWKGLILTTLFALGVIAFSYRMNLIYNQNNLTKGDSTFYFYSTGIVLQTAKSSGISNALSLAVSWLADYTILHYLVAAILSPVLPVNTSVAVLLNSIWYLLMAVSLHIFFWKRTQSTILSFLLPIPMLIAGPPLADPYQGLADLHVNLLGYTLGVSTMCLVLLSDDFRKPWPAVLAGAFFGLLLLGRVFSAALVGIVVAPIMLRGMFWLSKQDRTRAIRGILLFGGAVLLVSGWWFLPRLIPIVMYPLKFALLNYPGKAIAVGAASDNAIIWLRVVLSFFFYTRTYYALAIVLLAIAGAEIVFSRDLRSLMKRVNWLYVWMGISPLLVLFLIRSDYKYYGWPALLGLYLTAVFPFKNTEKSVQPLKKPVFQTFLLAALISASFGFATRMYSMHADLSASKQSATLVAEAILDDASQTSQDAAEVTIGFSYYGSLTPATLANVLLFDMGCPVTFYEPAPPLRASAMSGCKSVRMRYEFTQWPLYWDQNLSGDATRTVESALDQIHGHVDYVVILSPESWETEPGSYPKYWPEWVELSKQLYGSEVFDVITPIWTINSLETVVVLRRASRDGS